MAKFIKGDIIVIPFPFSDLSHSKRRPAIIVSVLPGNDLILCQITSQNIRDAFSISLNNDDFVDGSLKQPSNIRPNRIFTADKSIILYKIGSVTKSKITSVIDKIFEILNNY
ncbi:MAG: type II toxin-antitoxin system PemK/MazF family toxin [Syntrophaceae bacterium]|nr:type II toxin-antitoxin system PemK/MazF family toxin [Syntrophaceae bacterium]